MNKTTEDASWLVRTIFSVKTAIGIVICVVLIYLITMPWFTKPLYESEAIVYVPLTIPDRQINQQGVGFANEHEVDSYIQILKSTMLADSLIQKFGLQTDNHKNSALYKKLESRIKIEKTRYGSVSIKVRDHNPEKAASMANCIIELGESLKRNLLYPNRLEAMLYSKSLYEQKASELKMLEKNLDSIENKTEWKSAKKDFRYDKALTTYKLELQELISRKDQYERAKKDFETPLPKVYIISPAVALYRPVWPRRGILCVAGAFAYIFILLAIEIFKRDIREKPA